MFETLYLFLLRHKQLSLPEIGMISLQINSARTRFIDREVLPPVYSFRFSANGQPVPNKLHHWTSYHLNIPEEEAIQRFNAFVLEIKNQLQDGKEVTWNGVGKFSKGLMNEIEFEPEKNTPAFQQPVVAEKVTREHAKHVVVVGERERTGSDLSEIMAGPEDQVSRRSTWWIWPAALIFLSIIFIAWYFSENGVKASSTCNTEKSTLKEAPQGFYFSK